MVDTLRTPRFLYANSVWGEDTGISASSEQPDSPALHLASSAREARLLTQPGWNTVPRFNDAVPFMELESATFRVGRISPGNAPTGDDYAAAVQVAMNTATAVPYPDSALSPSAWYRADNVAGPTADEPTDGAAVATWWDASGNGRHLTSTGSRRPLFREAIAGGGMPALEFDGLDDQLVGSTALSALLGAQGEGTIIVVAYCQAAGPAVQRLVFSSVTAQHALDYDEASASFRARAHDGTQRSVSKAASQDAWHVLAWHKAAAATLGAGVDNSADSGLATTACAGLGGLSEFLGLGGNTGGQFKGYIAEVLVFATALDSLRRARVDDYLRARYGITVGSSPAWTNSYGATRDGDTKKFTLARTAGTTAFALRFADGAGQSAGSGLGFQAKIYDGLTSYASDFAVHHGAEFVDLDLGPAAISVDIVADWNDVIPVQRGASQTFVVQLTAGHYEDAATLCSMVTAALLQQAVWDTAWVWDEVTNKLTLTNHDSETFALLFLSGPRSAGPTLGFGQVDVQVPGNGSVTASSALWGWNPCAAGVVLDHNARNGGTFTLIGSTRRVVGQAGKGSAVQLVLAGNHRIRIAFLGEHSARRYFRLVIDDTRNEDGFCDLAGVYVGPYFEPSTSLAGGWEEGHEPLSVVQRSQYGAIYEERRPSPKVFEADFEMLAPADVTGFEDLQAVASLGRPFWFCEDPRHPQRVSSRTWYMALTRAIRFTHREGTGGGPDGDRHDARVSMLEVLP